VVNFAVAIKREQIQIYNSHYVTVVRVHAYSCQFIPGVTRYLQSNCLESAPEKGDEAENLTLIELTTHTFTTSHSQSQPHPRTGFQSIYPYGPR
jgi:hypothetical protein